MILILVFSNVQGEQTTRISDSILATEQLVFPAGVGTGSGNRTEKTENNVILQGTETEPGTKGIHTVPEQNRYFKSMRTG